MTDIECNTLSAEGVRNYDYVKWKAETLANQTSHKVGQIYKYLIPPQTTRCPALLATFQRELQINGLQI